MVCTHPKFKTPPATPDLMNPTEATFIDPTQFDYEQHYANDPYTQQAASYYNYGLQGVHEMDPYYGYMNGMNGYEPYGMTMMDYHRPFMMAPNDMSAALYHQVSMNAPPAHPSRSSKPAGVKKRLQVKQACSKPTIFYTLFPSFS